MTRGVTCGGSKEERKGREGGSVPSSGLALESRFVVGVVVGGGGGDDVASSERS